MIQFIKGLFIKTFPGYYYLQYTYKEQVLGEIWESENESNRIEKYLDPVPINLQRSVESGFVFLRVLSSDYYQII